MRINDKFQTYKFQVPTPKICIKFQINKSVIGYKKKIIPIPKFQRLCKYFNCINMMRNAKPFKTHYNLINRTRQS